MPTLYAYSDVNIDLTQQTDGDVERNFDNNAIRNSLANILSTRRGSRRMLPTFGANLDEMLFEQMDNTTARRIGDIILNGIEAWENRIVVENVNVNANYDALQYEVNVTYHIRGIGEQGRSTITFILRQT